MISFLLNKNITNILSYCTECLIILYFSAHLKKRAEGRAVGAGWLFLLFLAALYFVPINAFEPRDYSARNLLWQCVRMLMHIAVIFGLLLLDNEVHWEESLYLSCFLTVAYLSSQNFRNALVTIVQPLDAITVYRQVVSYLSLVFEWLTAWLLCRFLDLSSIQNIHKTRWAFVCIALLLEVYIKWSLITVSAEQILYVRWRDTAFFALMATIGVLLILVLFESTLQSQEKKALAEAEKLRIAYEMQNAKRSIQANNDIRRLYHDMKNHLLAIQSVAGGKEELDCYLKELLQQFSNYETQLATGNPMIDALLSEKMQRASTAHIVFNVVLDLRDLDFMHSVDLVTILGNAIDNAVEAVSALPQEEMRIVYVKSSQFANMKVLRISNQFAGTIEQANGLPSTRKTDAAMHGIGLKSIQKAAERYNGSVNVEYDNTQKWFRLMVMIPLRHT